MGKNLYQKYRPNKLNEIVGHKKIVEEFINRAKENNYPQVIHLTGLTGTGKTTLARIISKNLLCRNLNKENQSCNTCDICISIDAEKPLDVYYEYNASNIGIDEMRNIDEIARKKLLSKFQRKVIVIDELQELSANKKAQKNILKILEKSLKDTFFILGSMERRKVDKSIQDRATTYILKPLELSEIATQLKDIAEKEKVDIVQDESKINSILTLAENSNGSMRRAISFLERAIYGNIWTPEELIDALDIVSNENISKLTNSILQGDAETFFSFTSLNEEILNSIRSKLFIMAKFGAGGKLTAYERTDIQFMKKYPVEEIMNALTDIFELQKFNYLTESLIQTQLMKIMLRKKSVPPVNSAMPSVPLKRRRPRNE